MIFLRRLSTMLILFAVIAFAASPFVVPWLLENKIRTEFTRETGGQLSLDRAFFNPFSLSLTTRNLEVNNAHGDRLILLRSAKFDFDWSDLRTGSGTVMSDELQASWQRSGNKMLITLEHMSLDIFQGLQTISGFRVMSGFADGSILLASGHNSVEEVYLQVQDLALQGPPDMPGVRVEIARIHGLSYDKSLNQITVKSLTLDRPEIDIVRAAETTAAANKPEIGPKIKPAAANLNLLMPDVYMENGEVTFTDKMRSGAPVVLSEIAGRFSNVLVGNTIGAGFDLTASIGGESQLEVVGQFGQSDVLNASAQLRLDKLSYRHLTPYMFHLLGRGADAGTAYMDMHMAVTDDMLEGTLSLVFDQWKWGAKNPDYVGDPVPVRKAFNLLEGSGGRVRMAIPVEGNLADPTFKVDAVVRRATRRAIGDIVGAPFKLLGSLIPGGKSDLDLDQIEFAPSSAGLTPLDRSKLNALAAAMNLRPQLMLRIDGIAIPAIDLPDIIAGSENAVSEEERLQMLAGLRAKAVYNLLVGAGVDTGRLSIVILPLADTEKRKKPVVRLEISE